MTDAIAIYPSFFLCFYPLGGAKVIKLQIVHILILKISMTQIKKTCLTMGPTKQI